jgi:hypothetical protein
VTRADLCWFDLRFPRGLEEGEVITALSSLSGLPHSARLALELEADEAGIRHRLGVSAEHAKLVTANLRAAIPRLRLREVAPPSSTSRHRLLWQLAPSVAAVRTDDLAGVSAALLSNLSPLGKGERLRLTWHVRAGVTPSMPVTDDGSRIGRARALRVKLALPGMRGYGELRVGAASPARRRQLIQSVSAALRSLRSPHGRLVADPWWFGQLARLFTVRGRYLSAAELAAVIGWPIDGPDLAGLSLGAAKRLVPDPALPKSGRLIGFSDYDQNARPVALSPKAATRSMWLLGPTGTGKTSLLKHLIRSDLDQGRAVVVLETNGDLITELTDAIPPHRVDDVILLDPTDPDFAVGFNPLANASNPALVADQLSELFARLWSAYWGPRTAQLAHMGLLTLARRGNASLVDLPRLFLDPGFRADVLTGLDDPLGLALDWQWFEGLSEAEGASVVAPLLNKVRAFAARPAIRAIIGQPTPALSIRQIIEQKKVLLVHLPKGLIGAETAQLLGCLIFTSLWQALTARTAQPSSRRHPVNVYVDEVQDFAASPVPWSEMTAQGRKYGLALTVAHQLLDQLPKELRESLLANARSKAVFALGPRDAKTLESLFAPALSANDLRNLDPYTVAALLALDSGGTARPVTLTTPPPLDPLGSSEQVRASSRHRYARPIADIDAELRAQRQQTAPAAPVGRRPRRRP